MPEGRGRKQQRGARGQQSFTHVISSPRPFWPVMQDFNVAGSAPKGPPSAGRRAGNGQQLRPIGHAPPPVDRTRHAPCTVVRRARMGRNIIRKPPAMSKALDKTYDGIIIGAGHHGLILGTYLARAGLDILLVERRLTYGGGLCTREVTLPGFYHNLHSINHFHITETPWFKDLDLSERVTYITPRYEFGQAHRDGSRAGARARSGRIGRQHRALLQEGRRDLPRMESQGRKDHARDFPARTLCRAAAASRARSAAVAHGARPRIPRNGEPPAARCGARTVRERACPTAVLVQGVAVRHLADRYAVEDLADGLGDPRLRSRKRLPALPGRLVQSGARPDGGIHRRRRHATSRRCASTRSSSRTARPPASSSTTAARCGRSSSSPRRSTCIRPSRRWSAATQLACGVPEEARRLPIHGLEPVRPASGAQRKPALRGGKVRSQHQPLDEMEHRRRDHGGSVLRASGRAGRPRAEARAIRLRPAEPARSDPGAARQAHDLLLARDAAQSRHSAARATRASRKNSPTRSSRPSRAIART